MLRDDPKFTHYYRIVNLNANRPKKYSDWGDYNWSTNHFSGLATTEVLNKEDFKLCFSKRLAFVGDMQKKFDEVYECDNKNRWIQSASSHLRTRTEVIFKEVYIDRWIPILLINDFKQWIKSKFTKNKVKEDNNQKLGKEFEDLLYGENHNIIR